MMRLEDRWPVQYKHRQLAGQGQFYPAYGTFGLCHAEGNKKMDNKKGRKTGMGKEKLLDVLAKERMGTALEEALKKDGEYQHELGEQETAFGEMMRLLPDGELETVVDKAISATNSCGAAYGAAAYRQGFKDGARVARELGKIA